MREEAVGLERSAYWIVLLAVLVLGVSIPVGVAFGAGPTPEPLFDTCTPQGGAAGQCESPRGIATDPTDGHLFVADQINRRIDEFDAWGQFVKAWGYDVVASGPDNAGTGFEVCNVAAHPEDVCKAGVQENSGAGGFGVVVGVAVDSEGDVYTYDATARRVQKFDPAAGSEKTAEFLWTIGRNVNKTKVEEGGSTQAEKDICTAASGNVCQAGENGTEPGEFSASLLGAFIAVDTSEAVYSEDALYVGDKGRVQSFDTDGAYNGDFATPEAAQYVQSLAVDSSGDLYAAYRISGNNDQPDVHKLSPTGTELCSFEVENPRAIAIGGETLYAYDKASKLIKRFGTECASSAEAPVGEQEGLNTEDIGLAAGSACLSSGHDLYLANVSPESFLRVYGPAPDKTELCPQPPKPPQISAQFAGSVEYRGATLRAKIDPWFWNDTRFYVEYGTGKCSEGGCPNLKLAPPGSLLTSQVTDTPVLSPGIDLTGLEPATTYHFRVVAQSGGGGPVRGVGGTVEEDGAEGTFRTFALPESTSCPNEALRAGPGALLPDCRGYEMVSPVDKNGGNADAFELEGFKPNYDYKGIDQGAPGGDQLTYSVGAAFGGAEGSALVNQYLASRSEVADGAGSWSTKPISPPEHGGNARNIQVVESSPEFKAFSPDLRYGWVEPETGYPLAPCATEGYFNLYRRDLQSGQFVALCSADPEPECPAVYPRPEDFVACGLLPELQGVSEDQQHAIFRVNDKLTGEALPGRVDKQLYEWSAGGLRLVSKGLDGQASADGASAGTEEKGGQIYTTAGNAVTAEHALSADGSRAYWSTAVGSTNPRHLYLRLNSDQAQSTFKAPGTAATGLAGTTTLEGGGLTEGSTTVTKVSATSGAFAVGQRIVGEGIAPRTTITAVGAGSLTLSTPATKSTHVGTQTTLHAYSECSEPEKACTLPVSELVGAGEAQEAQFWDASPDGSRAIFSMLEAGDTVLGPLYEYDLAGEEAKLIAEEGAGVLGASTDLSKVYLAADGVCSENENSEGHTAQAGQPNVYLYEPGESCADKTLTFVGTLVLGDISTGAFGVGAPSPVASVPRAHVARVSPDGDHLAFDSTARLTGYDNTDANSGAADWEVYLYDATSGASGRLACASCNPSGARPEGANLQRGEGELWTAAWIPSYQFELYGRRPLSSDGKRLFFNSADPLTPRDTNGAQDVYEWEAPGTGTCTTSKPEYSAQNGGCVSLISTGESEEDSEFVEASTDGRDVFFRTEEGLAPQDPGLIDIYDARAGGGEAPAVSPPACEGDACQSVPPAPGAKTPGSVAFSGPGNLAPHGSCGAYGHRAAKLARLARRLRRHARLVSVPAKARLMRRKSARLTRRAHHLSKHAKRCRRANRRAR